MPKDASGKIILETADLCDTWEVSAATATQRLCNKVATTGWVSEEMGSRPIHCLPSDTSSNSSVPRYSHL